MVTQHHHSDTVSTYYNHHSDAVFLHMYVTKLSVVEKALESTRIHLNNYIYVLYTYKVVTIIVYRIIVHYSINCLQEYEYKSQ